MSFRLNENFNNSIPFLIGYKQLKIPIVDNGGNPAWPEIFPIEKIREIETAVGPRHFSAQMMLEYEMEEKIHLDPGSLRFYTDNFDFYTNRIGEHLISGVSVYWDPSSGRGKSDGSVCALVYKDDKNKTAFIHDVVYIRVQDDDLYPLASQCDFILDFLSKNNVNRIGIEINGLGNALPEIMRKVAINRNFPINIIQISNHTKKEQRILNAIEPMLNTGRLFMNEKIKQTMLLSEMLAWSPIGSVEHDDGLDAVAGALNMMPTPTKPINNHNRIIKANTDFKI
ncbi:MAG: hypothetical protein IKZ49_01005 [Alphaproteobacteria bacterium]|nr:hypothetical protein [Alphaproteobacteria bacterium]